MEGFTGSLVSIMLIFLVVIGWEGFAASMVSTIFSSAYSKNRQDAARKKARDDARQQATAEARKQIEMEAKANAAEQEKLNRAARATYSQRQGRPSTILTDEDELGAVPTKKKKLLGV